MSLLWRSKKTRLGLCADRILVSGAKPVVVAPGASALDALQEVLAARAGHQVSIVLADSFVRYMLLPFNAALKIDPKNWEAQFVKAASMTHWPADPVRDNDTVQRLAGLIDQQETMPSRPGFAQTYVVLGEQYQKMGQTDKATATWQLGLTKFPNDPGLQKKINGQ